MQEHAVRSSRASTIAIDQHAESVAMRTLGVSTGEARSAKFAGCPTAGDMVEWAAAWAGNVKFFAHPESQTRPEKRKDMARAVGMI